MEFTNGKASSELLQAQTALWNHTFTYIDSMSLKCAVDLGIPDAIHRHGRNVTIPELLTALSIPQAKSPYLRRLMRALTHSGVIACQRSPRGAGKEGDDRYLLTPLSRLLVNDKGAGLSPFLLAMLDPVLMTPFLLMGAWFKRDDESSPFAMAHGCGVWDVARRSPKFNEVLNESMATDTQLLMDVLLKECGDDVFQGLRSLVDVGGGTGSAARAIAKAFPQVRCTVLDLPHIVDRTSADDTVDYVAGDMFKSIPPADAVLLKSILHDWGDDDCVRILRRCKEAIPSKEAGGKVIIIDLVVGSEESQPRSKRTQLNWDMMMMVLCGGAEREEHEWSKLFMEAGFSGYKVTPIGMRAVIEVYP